MAAPARQDRSTERRRFRVRGTVQGVGFRPFVYALAHRHALSGWVLNDGEGVLIEAEGADLDAFQAALADQAPPLSTVLAVEAEALPPTGDSGFVIRQSGQGAVTTAVTADAAVCDACLAELFDPADRRYRYPFLNCTHCGPRFTITRRLPYDRPQTAMAPFALCDDCAHEYHDPADRRFHAQPVACPACGPSLSMPVDEIVDRLQRGEILAIKGLGGFHLACDARNETAVAALRRRKNREEKPFAVMAANLQSLRRLVDIDAAAADLLSTPARPIVVLERAAGEALAPSIAPGLPWVGVMLPYTPLHYLLFHEAAGRPDGTDWLTEAQDLVLVMTSANPGGEPLVIGNDEAGRRLAGIADAIVDHDRDIVIRADDSVIRMVAGAPVFIRRARGYVPQPIRLPRAVPPILAVGGYLKNTVCVTRGDEAFVSQHIGDLDNAETIRFFEETVDHLLHILQVTPEIVAHDLHPDFASSRYALTLDLPSVPVQHHHAHIAAIAAEYGIESPLLGLALDGFGLGTDGNAWGGELLRVDGADWERIGHLAPLAQPGGDAAARQPWRMAAAALHGLERGDEIAGRYAAFKGAELLVQLLDQKLNAAITTGCGRWFDAACGLLGVRPTASYEGQAPMELEGLAHAAAGGRLDGHVLDAGWTLRDGVLDLLPTLATLQEDAAAEGALTFHATLIAGLVDWVAEAAAKTGIDRVALGGGCLLNGFLAGDLLRMLRDRGLTPLPARRVPPNDGGLSLGQAWVAACRVQSRK